MREPDMHESQPMKTVAEQTAEVTTRILQLAGKADVMQKFIELTMPILSAGRAAGIHRQLRETLHDAMLLMEEAFLPPEYQRAFVEKAGELLCELERQFNADI